MIELRLVTAETEESKLLLCVYLLFANFFVLFHFYLFGALSGSTASLLFRNRQRVMMGRQLPAVMHYGTFSNAGLQYLCLV